MGGGVYACLLILCKGSAVQEIFRNTNLKAWYASFGGVGVVGTATAPRAWRSGVRNPEGIRDFSVFLDVKTDSGSHIPPYAVGTEVLYWE